MSQWKAGWRESNQAPELGRNEYMFRRNGWPVGPGIFADTPEQAAERLKKALPLAEPEMIEALGAKVPYWDMR